MKLPVSFSDADKARMLALVGAATVQLSEPTTSDTDKSELRQLIGLLASFVHTESVLIMLTAHARQLAMLESQLANLQRHEASPLDALN